MKKELCNKISKVLHGISYSQLLEIIEIPTEEKMGDFAIPCFSFAKVWHKNPAMIATEFKEILSQKKIELGINKVESVGGYCNIFINREECISFALTKMLQEDFSIKKSGIGKTVCMDYSSPNIAKNFHVGHLRTTVIGNSLYKIYSKLTHCAT